MCRKLGSLILPAIKAMNRAFEHQFGPGKGRGQEFGKKKSSKVQRSLGHLKILLLSLGTR